MIQELDRLHTMQMVEKTQELMKLAEAAHKEGLWVKLASFTPILSEGRIAPKLWPWSPYRLFFSGFLVK
jgi:hypothetical protein